MRTTLILLAALFLGPNAQANDHRQKVNTKIDRVTVFQQGAQVFRKSNLSIEAGITEVVFVGLSANINAQSIRIGGKGEFVILDVRHHVEYPSTDALGKVPTEVQRKIKNLKDSIADVNLSLRTLKAEMDALVAELNVLRNNKLTKGEGKSDSLGMFMEFMKFYRQQMNDIDRTYIRAEREHLLATERKRLMDERLAQLINFGNNGGQSLPEQGPDHQVVVTISADKAGPGRIDLSYMVSGASWEPQYDLRTDGPEAPLSIMYKASVQQSTAEDWRDVRLTLSTADPSRGTDRPVLSPWILQRQPVFRSEGGAYAPAAAKAMTVEAIEDLGAKELEERAQANEEPMKEALMSSELVNQQQRFATVEFEVPMPYTIAANGQPRTIALRTKELSTAYFHYLVPKLDRESYIVARTTGWQKLDMLPGTANIYYDGTYVGQTQIDPYNYADTVEFTLGRDPRVTANWERLKDETRGKPLAHDRVVTRVNRMAISNRTGRRVSLLIDDQIPVSRMEEVRVDLTRPEGGVLNPLTGTVRWEFNMEKTDKELRPEFTVTLPKDMQVSGL